MLTFYDTFQPPLEESSDDSKKSPSDSDKKEQKGDSLNSPFMEINNVSFRNSFVFTYIGWKLVDLVSSFIDNDCNSRNGCRTVGFSPNHFGRKGDTSGYSSCNLT